MGGDGTFRTSAPDQIGLAASGAKPTHLETGGLGVL